MKEQLSFGYLYDTDTNTLEAQDMISGYGLFSTVILLAAAASKVHNRYHILPDEVKTRNVMRRFKDNDDDDIFKKMFSVNKDIDIDPRPFSPDVHHALYRDSLIKSVSPYIKRYAAPSDGVVDAINDIKGKYDLEDTNRISVIYRGSDKWTDKGGFMDAGPGAYVRMAEKLKKADNSRQMIIQSEEIDICRFFRTKFKAFFIEETAVGDTGLTTRPIPVSDKETWLRYFIASLHIHAESDHLVTYTGNSGFFIVALRGHSNNVYQESVFCKHIDDLFYNEN